jgi:hypothetical protein
MNYEARYVAARMTLDRALQPGRFALFVCRVDVPSLLGHRHNTNMLCAAREHHAWVEGVRMKSKVDPQDRITVAFEPLIVRLRDPLVVKTTFITGNECVIIDYERALAIYHNSLKRYDEARRGPR